MCGIGGIVRWDGVSPDRDALERMADSLSHRGPDGRGVYRDQYAGLAHTRLAVIDPEAGQQPLSDAEQELWVTYNGEIYNYIELRSELENAGYRFRSRCDTEVFLVAFKRWGIDAFRKFNGQWAAAIWDGRKRRLWLTRDSFGIHPLYYTCQSHVITFASEVKALFAGNPSLPRAIDPVGLDQTLTLWSTIAPQTVFAGVFELEPGHALVFDSDGRREHTFATLDLSNVETHPRVEGEVDRVEAALQRATSLRRVRSDVPVGSYLSGGLDSSLLAALACREDQAPLHTFGIRFEEIEYDESHHQRTVAQYLGTQHHELLVRRSEITAAFPEVIRHAERPVLRTAAAPMYLLSQWVREHGIKVVLTGEGADELFGGYDLFREGKARRFWARNPDSTMRPRILERLYPYLMRSPVSSQEMARQFFGRDLQDAGKPGFAHRLRWRTTAALKRLLSADLRDSLRGVDAEARLMETLPQHFDRWTPLSQDLYLEMRTLLAGYLLSSQGDRMLMAHGVEGRFPFLDREVAGMAFSLPDLLKIRGLEEKHLLRLLGRRFLPRSIWSRSKQPYRAPDALAFATDPPDWVHELLSLRAIDAAGIFDSPAVSRLWAKCQRGTGALPAFSNAENMALTAVLSTQLLHHQFTRESRASASARSRRAVETNVY